MLFYTHLLIGVVVFLILEPFLPTGNRFLLLFFVLLGSVLPDIDERRSKINRWSGIIGSVVVFFSKHRGFFHSLLFFSVSSLLVYVYWSPFYAIGLFIGYLAHLSGDGITRMGVQILYPFSPWKVKGPIKVGGAGEGIVVILLFVVLVRLLF